VEQLKLWVGEPWSVILLSEASNNLGSGKTRALCNVVREWRNRGERAFYLPVARVIQVEHEVMDNPGLSENGTVPWCCTLEGMLALDDLGAEHDDRGGWAAGLVEQIADERYSNERPTIFAANLTERALQVRYPRLWRRCTEGIMLAWQASRYEVKV
jgi:DNA replication protein DnaC